MTRYRSDQGNAFHFHEPGPAFQDELSCLNLCLHCAKITKKMKGLYKLMDETPHPEHDHPARIPMAIEGLNT